MFAYRVCVCVCVADGVEFGGTVARSCCCACGGVCMQVVHTFAALCDDASCARAVLLSTVSNIISYGASLPSYNSRGNKRPVHDRISTIVYTIVGRCLRDR